ncbi:MAG TPA: protein phosphatase 2C domain-containing protein [Anaerolineales bacterium]|nr:protein phosphatase 2C domain-containing protein [Anaerolineales bacterium]
MKRLWESLINKKESPKSAAKDSSPEPALQKIETSDAETAPLSEEQIDEIIAKGHRIDPTQLIVGSARNVGKAREKNEDAIFAHTSLIGAGTTSLPFGVFVLADGMGGHRHGEMASESAVRKMGSFLINKLFTSLFGPNPNPPEESLQEIMKIGVQQTHKDVVDTAPGGGTTMTAVITIGTQMTLAHVGDSRAYAVFLDGRMQLLTRDHSLVKRLEELGQITAEEAANHPQKSMLYRALGQGDAPEPDVFTASLPHPGYLMICSDGLWGVLAEERIFQIISESPNPQRACQNLVDAANAAGGPDNITVILVRLSD